VPERRGLPESTRSISDQPGGPLLKPTDSVYRIYVRISRSVFAGAHHQTMTFELSEHGFVILHARRQDYPPDRPMQRVNRCA
jgi:hypothetical protein